MNSKVHLNSAKNFRNLRENDVDWLIDCTNKHFDSFSGWDNGIAYEIFVHDNCLCVKYANGEWWHYSKNMTWY